MQACTSASAVNYDRHVPAVIVKASGGLYFMFCIPRVISNYIIDRYQRLLLQRVTSGPFLMTYASLRLLWCLYRSHITNVRFIYKYLVCVIIVLCHSASRVLTT